MALDMSESSTVPGGYKWVVLASSFFSLLLNGFMQYQAGVMSVMLTRQFPHDVTSITWLVAYYSGAFALWGKIM